MHCTCVRQSDLPNTTSLFKDVLYHPDKTAPFYQHPLRNPAAFQAAARQIEFSAERRAALIDALRVQNPQSPALQRLAEPGTLAVVTGQQVGLFSGPCYTIYKALHAVKLASWLSANLMPAVPVFWLATEDHDFAEVNHSWVFGADYQPRKLEMRRAPVEQPAGFLEYAEVFGNYYGTAKRFLREATARGHDLLLDIDVQGAAQVKQKVPEAVSIFILPPSRAELERRLRRRAEADDDLQRKLLGDGARLFNTEDIIQRRLQTASREIENFSQYDYILVN